MAMGRRNSDDGGCESVQQTKITPDYEAHINFTELGDVQLPMIIFKPDAVLAKPHSSMRHLGEKFKLTFKLIQTGCKLVRSIVLAYGFHEVHPNSPDFNLLWSSTHLRPSILASLTEFQKVNHFPRSFELTRKDRLYKNIQRIQQIQGVKNFDFIPQSFVVPMEYNDFCAEFKKWRGLWIVKPLALSRGRGIFIVSKPDDLPLDEALLVSRYIENPLLINGYKFDLRLYAAVTSFEPLVIYLYREGIVRFATEKYKRGARHVHNQCMHLTNYSVNRHSAKYVRCYDPKVEDYGNKWSLTALLGHLKRLGHNTDVLLSQIKDVVVKSIIAAEAPISAACRAYVPHLGNCFELYGFDIMLDETLRPWLLEINFSPSLSCDMPLDLKIKARLVADVLTLTGMVAHDPLLKRFQQKQGTSPFNYHRPSPTQQRRASSVENLGESPPKASNYLNILRSLEDGRMVDIVQSECNRMGYFARVHPTQTSWEMYGQFIARRHAQDCNLMLHRLLFPSPTLSSLSLGCISNRKKKKKMSERCRLAKWFLSPNFQKCKSESVASWEGMDGEAEDGHSSAAGSSGYNDREKLDYSQNIQEEIIHRVSSGESLSQLQARQAFAVYLTKIQLHLMATELDPEADTAMSTKRFKGQLDLTMQFLQYAASNLPDCLDLISFDKQMDVWTQRDHVVSQIDQFISAYTWETHRLSKLGLIAQLDSSMQLHPRLFDKFMQEARASDLEEVLTIVAHKLTTSWFLESIPRTGAFHDSRREANVPALRSRMLQLLQKSSSPNNREFTSTATNMPRYDTDWSNLPNDPVAKWNRESKSSLAQASSVYSQKPAQLQSAYHTRRYKAGTLN